MPNGGFGCAYCVYLANPDQISDESSKDINQSKFCVLRETRISSPFWTVCSNINYGGIDERIFNMSEMEARKKLSNASRILKGSIFSITSQEGAYIEVPWLGIHEVMDKKSLGFCDNCNLQVSETIRIKLPEKEFVFCTFLHYMEWRSEYIKSNNLPEEMYLDNIEKIYSKIDFTKLKVISENASPEDITNNQIRYEKFRKINKGSNNDFIEYKTDKKLVSQTQSRIRIVIAILFALSVIYRALKSTWPGVFP